MDESLRGDKTAYESLLNKVATLVRGYLFNTMSQATRTDERIEDLVQDVLLAIHRKKHLYRPDMPVLPWLFAIARYRLIDHLRNEKRKPIVEWDDNFDAPEATPGPTHIDHAFEIEELLAHLSPRQKEILLLAKADGVPLAQIAERYQMSLSAVKVTIHRALNKVRSKNPPL